MKHIKKFNELNTQTYHNAARQFHKMAKTNPDFRKRAYELENWAETIRWKNNLEQLKKDNTPLVSVELVNNKWSGKNSFKLTDDMYISLFINTDLASDTIEDELNSGEFSIPFEVRFIPNNKDIIDEFSNTLENVENFTDMILIWGALEFKIISEAAVFQRIRLDSSTEYGDLKITRPMVNFIRKRLLNYLDEDCKIDTGYNRNETMYSMLNLLLAETGISSEYGITLEYIKDEITKLNANKILANYK